MKRDYAITFAAEALVVVSYLIVFRLVAQHLGATGFGEYSLARRTLALLVPLGMIGADVGITRFISFAPRGGGSGPDYTAAGTLVIGSGMVAISILLVALHTQLAQLFYGSTGYVHLIWPLPLLLLGSGSSIVAFAALRGEMRMGTAAMIMVLNQAVVPLVAVLVGGPAWVVLDITGAGWLAVSSCFILVAGVSISGGLIQRTRELFAFGLPRIPGDVLQLALFSVPGIVVAHVADIRVAGVVAFVLAALRMIGSMLTPVSYVLLPVASRLVASSSYAELDRQVRTVVFVTATILVAGTVVVEVGADRIVAAYLGSGFGSTVPVLRLLMLGALPFGLYAALRSVIDAHHHRAINSRNTAIAFGAFAAISTAGAIAGASVASTMAGFVVALYVLAGLTLFEVNRIRRSEPPVPGELDLQPVVEP